MQQRLACIKIGGLCCPPQRAFSRLLIFELQVVGVTVPDAPAFCMQSVLLWFAQNPPARVPATTTLHVLVT